MIDSQPDGREAEAPRGRGLWMQRGILAAVCALVIGVYAYTAHSGVLGSGSLGAADNYYNLLVQGFRAGRLSLKKEVPPGLAQLADPYDPTENALYRFAPYGMHDLSYYKGKLYLYFGVTPALILLWPYVALTGHYLPQEGAAVIFCVVGFLVSVGLLCALWRRYFAEVSVVVVAAGTLALGLATFTPLLLARCDVYEVSISCGYALTMLAVAAIWKALHESRKRSGWLAAASLAYGLAVGARPSLLFGAVILLVPVVQAWRERRTVLAPLLAMTGPMVVIGLGLMIYNALRFDNPFEFGGHYQLSGERLLTRQFFSLRYLWFNFRVYFLEPARWSGQFPFVHDITEPPLPAGYEGCGQTFGVLTNIPLVWLALAVPLAWRGRSAETRSRLCKFLVAVAVLLGIAALTLGLFVSAQGRYEVDFLPALVLLAVTGILSLERALAPTSESGLACRPVWRRAARLAWSLLLGFSVAFNLLASVDQCADSDFNLGVTLMRLGKVQEAIGHYEQALRRNPDFYSAHNNLGSALLQAGKATEAIGHYEQALRIKPDFAEAHYNFGVTLEKLGRTPEAIGHYEQAIRINPDFAEPHNNLGYALLQAGKVPEAIGHYEQAVRIKPDFAAAHYNLGRALVQQGRLQEAISHWEQALRLAPDFAEVHYNLGLALVQQGRLQEVISHWEQALRLAPDFAEVHYNLGLALVQQGRLQEAISHWEQALSIKPDYAAAHYNLGVALEKLGRTPEAIQHYQQALRITPDFTLAQNALARLQAGQ
jgi:tetratricopeptide (TPR) repeat protein